MRHDAASFAVPQPLQRSSEAEAAWMLRASLAVAAGLVAACFMLLHAFGLPPAVGGKPAAAVAAVQAFDIDAELASLLLSEPVDLAANVDMAGDTFTPAKGPPLDLLAQIEPTAPVRLAAVIVSPPAAEAALAGPVLTAEELMIVDANAERREVRVALLRLQDRAANGETELAPAMAVQPILRRAELAAASLDSYGDALLLSEGEAMKQIAYFGFQASRAAALRDIERAEAILG